MNQIKSKIYYIKSTGNVLVITPEYEGSLEASTKEEDMLIYPELKDLDPDDIGYIELEYGTLAQTFANVKSYFVDVQNKILKCIYFSQDELNILQNQIKSQNNFQHRIAIINEYIANLDENGIIEFEDFILQREKNK